MMSVMVCHDEEQHQRLSAIARLEQRNKMKRSLLEQNGQTGQAGLAVSTEKFAGKYFLLLVSRGSGNVQQRANQDRAEAMLAEMSHEVLDGSNFTHTERRNELFEVSKVRGNYPQLFLVENGATTFVGDFESIEFHNDEGTLKGMLAATSRSPTKRKSIVGSMKSLFSGGGKRDSFDGTGPDEVFSPSELSSLTLITEQMLAISVTDKQRASNRSMDIDRSSVRSMKPEHSGSSRSLRSGASSHRAGKKSPMNESLLSEETGIQEKLVEDAFETAFSLGRRHGELPLRDDEKKQKKLKSGRRSRSKSRSKDVKRSSSKSKHHSHKASAGGVSLNDGDDSPTKSRKKRSKSSKSGTRSRSKSTSKRNIRSLTTEGKEGSKDDVASSEHAKSTSRRRSQSRSQSARPQSRSRNGRDLTRSAHGTHDEGGMALNDQDGGKKMRKSRSRSKSRRKRDLRSISGERTSDNDDKSGKDDEASSEHAKSTSRRRSQSRSQSARPQSRSSNGRDLTRNAHGTHEEDGMVLNDQDGGKKMRKSRSRSKSRSKRDLRSIPGEQTSDDDDKRGKAEKRRSLSKRDCLSKDGENKKDKTKKTKSRSKAALIADDGEKKTRRSGVRSSSPHRLKEKTKRSETSRSKSPGKFRGDIARKREAMKEFREKKSSRSMSDDGMKATALPRKLRKQPSLGQIDTASASFSRSPRPHQSLNTSSGSRGKRQDLLEGNNERLDDLIKRVKDKGDKKGDDDADISNDNTTRSGTTRPSVEW